VPDIVWEHRSPLQEDHLPQVSGEGGIRLRQHHGVAVLAIYVRRGGRETCHDALRKHFRLEMSSMPRLARTSRSRLVWAGHDQFLALTTAFSFAMEHDLLADALGESASLSDHSDSRFLVEIGGTRVRDLLAKLVSVDTHPSAFPVGMAVATTIEHTPINLWRENDDGNGDPVFLLISPRSYADSIWHLLTASAREFGVSTDNTEFS
jgi:sarcosine oxidase subunit gamma